MPTPPRSRISRSSARGRRTMSPNRPLSLGERRISASPASSSVIVKCLSALMKWSPAPDRIVPRRNHAMNIAALTTTLLLFAAAPAEMPKVHDDRLQLQLVAESPDVRTPTGLAMDSQGRVLVIESHTHFPPDKYDGPKHDRILLMQDFAE